MFVSNWYFNDVVGMSVSRWSLSLQKYDIYILENIYYQLVIVINLLQYFTMI